MSICQLDSADGSVLVWGAWFRRGGKGAPWGDDPVPQASRGVAPVLDSRFGLRIGARLVGPHACALPESLPSEREEPPAWRCGHGMV